MSTSDDFDARLREARRTGRDRISDPVPPMEIDPNVRHPHFGAGARTGARPVGPRGLVNVERRSSEDLFRSWATDERDSARARR